MTGPRRGASLERIARDLRRETIALRFGPPVTHVYAPLDYAWAPHARYLALFDGRPGKILMIGMNPGPFGMAQTGVPFGDPAMVRDWIGIEAPVRRPRAEHPRRPVLGFACERAEVSGRRLWGWARDRYATPRRFFDRFFVMNYCPLAFMEDSGRNVTPDRLARRDREALIAVCDRALRRAVDRIRPAAVMGIGRWAESRARQALEAMGLPIHGAPHPSPASPAANRGWALMMDAAVSPLREAR